MSNQFLTRLSAILLLIVLILGYFAARKINSQGHEIDRQVNLVNALNDTLKFVRMIDGGQKATIAALTTSKTEDLLKIKSKDSTIKKLQNTVAQYKDKLKDGGSVTIVEGETKFVDTGSTKYVYYTDQGDSCKPTYHTTKYNKWYIADMRMNKDTSILGMQIYNSYEVIIGKDKKDGWFADVINHNPYSVTKEMRAYNVEIPKQKPKRVALGIFGGYGVPLNGSNNTLKSGPFIGAGITYNFLYLF